MSGPQWRWRWGWGCPCTYVTRREVFMHGHCRPCSMVGRTFCIPTGGAPATLLPAAGGSTGGVGGTGQRWKKWGRRRPCPSATFLTAAAGVMPRVRRRWPRSRRAQGHGYERQVLSAPLSISPPAPPNPSSLITKVVAPLPAKRTDQVARRRGHADRPLQGPR